MFKIFISILFLIVSILIFVVPVKQGWEDIKILQAEKKEFNVALANSRELQTLRDEVLEKYNAIPQIQLDKLEQLLPSQIKTISLVIEIADRARANNMLLKDIEVEKTSDDVVLGKTFDAAPKYLNLTIVGKYSSLLDLLNAIADSLRLIEIENLSFTSGDTDLYEFKIKAKTYYQP